MEYKNQVLASMSPFILGLLLYMILINPNLTEDITKQIEWFKINWYLVIVVILIVVVIIAVVLCILRPR